MYTLYTQAHNGPTAASELWKLKSDPQNGEEVSETSYKRLI